DRDQAAGEKTVSEIKQAGGQAEFVLLDIAREDDCQRVSAEVLQTHGRLDVLVNNAGIGHVGTILQTEGKDLDRLYAVSVRGAVDVRNAVLAAMSERKPGNVMSLASLGGVVGSEDRLAYCATKFALVGLTKCLGHDAAQGGVHVNCTCRGRGV